MPLRDLKDQRFGRLVVVGFAFIKGNKYWWKCKCDCGSIKNIRTDNLHRADTRSCGCLSREISKKVGNGNATHGRSMESIYNIWKQIKQRCNNPKNHAFSDYGGRGITVCDKWNESFQAFLDDMGERPPGMTIDRADNDGPYSPENCKWSSRVDQCRNTRSNVFFERNGKNLTLSQWAKEMDISTTAIDARIHKLGWSVEKAIFTPLSSRGRKRNIFPNSPGNGF